MLALVDRHTVLTTDQLLVLEFGSLTRAQHRLAELRRLDVLWRFRHPLVSGGSRPWHYTVGYTYRVRGRNGEPYLVAANSSTLLRACCHSL